MNIDPTSIYENLVKLGEEWAEANCAADLMEETKKPLVAQLMNESNGKTLEEKESFALSHKEYASHIRQMVFNRKEANKCKVRYDSAKIYSELLRTQNANERAVLRSAP